ncbi:MAG: trigger factor, partial [Candidatus Krumholzibacteria bacterium]|nr:trigger factor [Candidatus Krumholzibacteria bacterium]
LQPIGDPIFRDVKAGGDEPLRFTVDIEVEPVIELSSYRGIDVGRREPTVEDEEVERVLESIREREASYEPVERGAGVEDVVVLDYAPLGEDGAPDEQRRVAGYPVQLGAGQLFPAFEEAIAGLAAGQTGRAAIDYPGDYQPEHLAGKRIEYLFTVKEVREKRIPALDDALASKVDEKFTTLDELRGDIRERLREEKEREERRRREEEAVDRILDANPFDIPGTMIERYRAELHREDERRREAAGVEPEQDEQRRKEIDELFERIARRNIKRFFLIDRIADLEKIAVAESELKEEIDRIAAGSGRPREEAEAFFAPGSDHRRNLRGRIRERKVMEILLGEGEKSNG